MREEQRLADRDISIFPMLSKLEKRENLQNNFKHMLQCLLVEGADGKQDCFLLQVANILTQ